MGGGGVRGQGEGSCACENYQRFLFWGEVKKGVGGGAVFVGMVERVREINKNGAQHRTA